MTTSQKSIPQNITRNFGCDRPMASRQPISWCKVNSSQRYFSIVQSKAIQQNWIPCALIRAVCLPMTKAANPCIVDLQLGSVTSWVNRPVALDTKIKNKRWPADLTDKQMCLPISQNPKSVLKGIMSLGIGAKIGANPTKSCSLDTTLRIAQMSQNSMV